MRKSLILVLTAIGGGASYAAGVNEAATNAGEPSTWRWQVSSALAEQSDAASAATLGADAFNQRYERYSPRGLPQARGNPR